jgi:hypothetical protein
MRAQDVDGGQHRGAAGSQFRREQLFELAAQERSVSIKLGGELGVHVRVGPQSSRGRAGSLEERCPAVHQPLDLDVSQVLRRHGRRY